MVGVSLVRSFDGGGGTVPKVSGEVGYAVSLDHGRPTLVVHLDVPRMGLRRTKSDEMCVGPTRGEGPT